MRSTSTRQSKVGSSRALGPRGHEVVIPTSERRVRSAEIVGHVRSEASPCRVVIRGASAEETPRVRHVERRTLRTLTGQRLGYVGEDLVQRDSARVRIYGVLKLVVEHRGRKAVGPRLIGHTRDTDLAGLRARDIQGIPVVGSGGVEHGRMTAADVLVGI